MKIFLYTLLIAAIALFGWGLIKESQIERKFEGIVLGREGRISGEYPLADIISIDEFYVCDFERSDRDSRVTGKIYIAPGPKVRGDFSVRSEASAEPFESHFILRDGAVYNWTSLVTLGFKNQVTELKSVNIGVASLGDRLDYECERMETERTKFDLPGDIIFSNQ